MVGDRKTELLEITIGLIATRGYDSFSYADLAQASGLTKASVHHHFPGKEDLAVAVLDHLNATLIAPMQVCLQEQGPAALGLVMQSLGQRDWGAQVCPFASMHAQFNVLPIRVQQRLTEVTALEVQVFAALLQAHATQPGMRLLVEPDVAARILLSAAKGALFYGRAMGGTWLTGVVPPLMELILVQDAV